MDPPQDPDIPDLDPATPVMVEWYAHKRKAWIPRRHHAVMVPYRTALHWHRQGIKIVCHTIDEELLRELRLDTPRPK
jgi:hypothetical protein